METFRLVRGRDLVALEMRHAERLGKAKWQKLAQSRHPLVITWAEGAANMVAKRKNALAYGPLGLEHRLGLSFALALTVPAGQKVNAERFLAGVTDLPSEVILYWFTLCFYGHRRKAARKALAALLLTPEDKPKEGNR